jgi:hypothetical protein
MTKTVTSGRLFAAIIYRKPVEELMLIKSFLIASGKTSGKILEFRRHHI